MKIGVEKNNPNEQWSIISKQKLQASWIKQTIWYKSDILTKMDDKWNSQGDKWKKKV